MKMPRLDEQDAVARIRKAMARWKDMDAAGRQMGRGLGRQELLGRVAMETGSTVAAVKSALRE